MLEVVYDANDNRITKLVRAAENDPETHTDTFYVKDADGKIMGNYERTNLPRTDLCSNCYEATFKLLEQPLYGSRRIGQVAHPNGGVNLGSVIYQFQQGMHDGVIFGENGLQSSDAYYNWR